MSEGMSLHIFSLTYLPTPSTAPMGGKRHNTAENGESTNMTPATKKQKIAKTPLMISENKQQSPPSKWSVLSFK